MLTLIVAKQGDGHYGLTYRAEESDWPNVLPTFERMAESIGFTN
jgi:hypothetical protein